MQSQAKGPVAAEIETRLQARFAPSKLNVINESASHAGHRGDDGSGESHFAIDIESTAFSGVGRLERQRMVNRALGDLSGQRVHAIAIKARAPEEQPGR